MSTEYNVLQFVLDNNFFVCQGSHYKQIFGCPMGPPVNAIVANLVVEHVEEALSSALHPPKCWHRETTQTVWPLVFLNLEEMHIEMVHLS